MSISFSISIDAATAAANADHHCEHPSGARTITLTAGGTANQNVYVHAAHPGDLRRLAEALVSIADDWLADRMLRSIFADDDSDENACDRCGTTVPNGEGRYPDGVAGDRICQDCSKEEAE